MIPSLGSSFGQTEGTFLSPTLSPGQSRTPDAGAFQKLALNSLQEAGGLEQRAHTIIADGISGGDMSMTESVVAMRQADIAMRLMMQVQRKLVDAWNELRNMQV